MTFQNYRCSCGEDIISHALRDQIRLTERTADVMTATNAVDTLKATDGFTKDLRDLKKTIARGKRAHVALNRVCRDRRHAFITETRPFVERIYDLQKNYVKEVSISVEAKALRSESRSINKKLQAMERVYPRFKKDITLYTMLHLGSPWRLRCMLRPAMWKMKRFFRTKPRLL